jgi:transcription elongation factor SPT6
MSARDFVEGEAMLDEEENEEELVDEYGEGEERLETGGNHYDSSEEDEDEDDDEDAVRAVSYDLTI